MSDLGRLIAEEIAADGPMPVARFMTLALGHPIHGYYTTRDPLGRAGDFVTAPEISQMFGELLGLWCAEVWRSMGAPDPVLLVELGPGRGTLMADALRAARLVPAFVSALRIHLVETSPALKARQAETLAPAGRDVRWHDMFATLPPGPMVLLANEFFDALPVHQFERRNGRWHERCVGLDADGRLAFRLAPDPLPATAARKLLRDAPEGTVRETSPERDALAREIGARLARDGGAALVVDYGSARSGFGDTLQAVRAHRYASPLDRPGEADLTAHVDFARLGAAARAGGAATHGPVEMAPFLRGLGIAERAGTLKSRASSQAARAVDAALARLTGPDQMGSVFKVLALTAPHMSPPPPFTDCRQEQS